MTFLAAARFWPILPEPGLIFWTILIFFLFWMLMSRFAFKPIADALAKRNGDIEDALKTAEQARLEMANLKSENEKLLSEAREERAKMLKEAKETGNATIEEAKEKARQEAQKIITNARQEIENQKLQAMKEVKNEAGNMALEIAEKVIRRELKGDASQTSFVNDLVNEIKLN